MAVVAWVAREHIRVVMVPIMVLAVLAPVWIATPFATREVWQRWHERRNPW